MRGFHEGEARNGRLTRRVGGTILGDYRLIRRLGGGTFGVVYLAEQLTQKRSVAVKILRTQLHRPEELRDFLNEARVMRLHHRHIIQMLDFGVSRENTPYLVMEYASGGALRDRYPRGTRLPLTDILAYTEQLASALQYAHEQRLIHRDIKPENLLLRGDGTVVLSDFGIAKVVEHTPLAHSTRMLGTPVYMAPEQSQGKPVAASDQYALAVMVYGWISGQHPFQGDPLAVVMQHRLDAPPSLMHRVPGLSPEIDRVVLKALSKEPTERFTDIQAFADALRHAIETAKISPFVQQSQLFTGKASSSTVKPYPSLRSLLLAGLILVLLSAALGTFFTLHSFQSTGAQGATTTTSTYDATRDGVGFGLDPGHSRNDLAERSISPLTISRLTQFWTFTTGGAIISSPTVVNKEVYVGSEDDKLYAFNANGCGRTTCKPLWSASAGNAIDSSPAVSNGVVYIGSEDDKLYAFNANGCGQTTCKPLWSASTGNAIRSSPTIANGIVYMGSSDHKVYAFNAEGCGKTTCQPLWSALTGGIIVSSPAVAHGIVYVGSEDSKLYAFKAAGCGQLTCHPLWSASTGHGIDSSPAVVNGIVYIGSYDNKLYAFNAMGCGKTTCQPLWSALTGGAVYSSPAVSHGIVYIGSGDHRFYAFKADGCGQTTCKPLWSAVTANYVDSSPTIANGIAYVGSYDNKLYAFNAMGCGQATCKPLWSATTADAILSSPAVANGTVYVGSWDHTFYTFHV